MIYTLNKGIDDRHERIQSYILRGLPIVVASMVAVAGAFSLPNRNQTDSNNQEPLAIYTAPPTDLGDSSNPQGNSGDPQADPSQNNDQPSTPAPESRVQSVTSPSGSSASVSTSPAPSASVTTQPLPVGGSGGDEDSCPCQAVQDAVGNVQGSVTGVVEPIIDPLP